MLEVEDVNIKFLADVPCDIRRHIRHIRHLRRRRRRRCRRRRGLRCRRRRERRRRRPHPHVVVSFLRYNYLLKVIIANILIRKDFQAPKFYLSSGVSLEVKTVSPFLSVFFFQVFFLSSLRFYFLEWTEKKKRERNLRGLKRGGKANRLHLKI